MYLKYVPTLDAGNLNHLPTDVLMQWLIHSDLRIERKHSVARQEKIRGRQKLF